MACGEPVGENMNLYFCVFHHRFCARFTRTMPEHAEIFGANWTKCHHLEAVQDEDDLATL